MRHIPDTGLLQQTASRLRYSSPFSVVLQQKSVYFCKLLLRKYSIWRGCSRFSRSSHLSWSSARGRTLCFCKASGSVNASPSRAAEGRAAHGPETRTGNKIKLLCIRGGSLRANPRERVRVLPCCVSLLSRFHPPPCVGKSANMC